MSKEKTYKDQPLLRGVLHFSDIGTPFVRTEEGILIVSVIQSIMLFKHYGGNFVEYYECTELDTPRAAIVCVNIASEWKCKEDEHIENPVKVLVEEIPVYKEKTWKEILLEAEWEAGIKVPEDLVEFLEKYYHYPKAINSKK